jgi:hypothetical protein
MSAIYGVMLVMVEPFAWGLAIWLLLCVINWI